MNNEKGFIMLSRKFFSNKMWEAARTFSECEAWLDLIQSARFEATDTTKCIGGREITYTRGQYPASNRFLANKWKWGEQKVKTFLSKLKKEGMITTDCSQGMNIITLVKYNDYNTKNPPNNPANNPPKTLINNELNELLTHIISQQITQCQPSYNPNNNKDNKDNKENNNIPPTPPKGEGINYKARLIFEKHFSDTFGNAYYWTAKDAGNMSKIIQKLTFSCQQKGSPTDEESILKALKIFLSSIKEGWIFENFSVSNINSKFNEIRTNAHKKNNTNDIENIISDSKEQRDQEFAEHIARKLNSN